MAAGGSRARLVVRVHGLVQGVGFRWWTGERARELSLAGSARNLQDGSVEVIAEGTGTACERLLSALESASTPGRVDSVDALWERPHGDLDGFVGL